MPSLIFIKVNVMRRVAHLTLKPSIDQIIRVICIKRARLIHQYQIKSLISKLPRNTFQRVVPNL